MNKTLYKPSGATLNKPSRARAGTHSTASTSRGSGAFEAQSRPRTRLAAAIAKLRGRGVLAEPAKPIGGPETALVAGDESAFRELAQVTLEDARHDALAAKTVVEAVRVRCLACGAPYFRTLLLHECVDSCGCPKCGYVGWAKAVR